MGSFFLFFLKKGFFLLLRTGLFEPFFVDKSQITKCRIYTWVIGSVSAIFNQKFSQDLCTENCKTSADLLVQIKLSVTFLQMRGGVPFKHPFPTSLSKTPHFMAYTSNTYTYTEKGILPGSLFSVQFYFLSLSISLPISLSLSSPS